VTKRRKFGLVAQAKVNAKNSNMIIAACDAETKREIREWDRLIEEYGTLND
jgi:hypothetical protein